MNIKLSVLFFFIIMLGFSQNKEVTVKNLKINNETDHFGVSSPNDNQVVLTANNLDSKGRVKTYRKSPELGLYQGNISKNGEIIDLKPLEIQKKLSSFNIASSAFSPDEKHIYITTNFKPKGILPNGKSKPVKLRIERGEFIEGKGWTNFKVLPFCNADFSYGQPAVSPDGKTLYFVSSMRGSRGRTDIYKVDINDDATYSEPVKLGNTVNSVAKEVFPFVGKDGYLYYSAKKRDGLGRLDVYKSKINEDGTYGKSELLPEPINSPYDDYGFMLNSESKSGYFSSNRRGGKGGEDVYSFSFE